MSIMPCIACGGTLSLFGRRSDYEYFRCLSCGTIQLNPLPDKVVLEKAYTAEYAGAGHYEPNPDVCYRSARSYYQSILKTLQDYGVKGLVLDYGAGWGGLVELLVKNGFNCQGVEISRDMVSYCQKRGLKVESGDITTLAGKSFDALVLCTVFEHLVGHEDFLTRANQLLREEGLLFTLQPTAPFANLAGRIFRLGDRNAQLPGLIQVFCPPWHTVFFSFDGMQRLMSRHGFELIEIRPAPQGRWGGLMTVLQRFLESINRVGWAFFKRRWPLVIAHIFVFRKVGSVGSSSAYEKRPS
jgi:SAM-dependent methyltransferase